MSPCVESMSYITLRHKIKRLTFVWEKKIVSGLFGWVGGGDGGIPARGVAVSLRTEPHLGAEKGLQQAPGPCVFTI